MAAYLIAEVRIDDSNAYLPYVARTPDIISQFGGRILARGGPMEILEGHTDKTRVVIVEFPSMEAARRFYNSPQYQQAREFRLSASEAQLVLVQGV